MFTSGWRLETLTIEDFFNSDRDYLKLGFCAQEGQYISGFLQGMALPDHNPKTGGITKSSWSDGP